MAVVALLFDEVWYGSSYPDVVAAGIPGLVHYVNSGWKEWCDPHPLFSTKWFRSQWKERPHTENDLSQYLLFKSPETTSPHPAIDEKWYRMKYLGNSNMITTAAEHYVESGYREGNSTSQSCDASTLRKIEYDLGKVL